MSNNYRKEFNIRNGVQIDDDNFIVNPNGLVGIGTSIPTEFLDVRGNVKVVGLVTTNNLYAGVATVGFLTATQGLSVSGVVTATSFSGSASGLTDIYAIAVDGWYINSGNSTISTSFSVGIGTTIPRGNLQVGTGVTINSTGNASYSGIITAASFSGSGADLTALNASQLTGTINNSRLPSNINVSGIITASSGFVGNLTGIASTAHSITTSANITVNSINSGFSTTGVSTVFTTSHVGTGGTAFAALNSGRIGIGTALPTSELQIRKSSGSLLEVISDSGQSRISIGQSVGVGRSTAVLRFGNASKTFDIINNDTGNINLYLHADTTVVGIDTGKFRWIYGQTNNELMTLNYDGTLTATGNVFLGSSGISSVTVQDNLYVKSDLFVDGTLSANIDYPDIISNTNLNNNSGITTLQKLNVTSNIGINSSNPSVGLDAKTSTALFNSIGINTTIIGQEQFACNGFARFQSIGIGTTALYEGDEQTGSFQLHNNSFRIFNGTLVLTNSAGSGIGFGTYSPRSILDFGLVGSATSLAYFIPPTVSNAGRETFYNVSGLTTSPGAIIFNSSINKHQAFDGTNWHDLY